MRGALRAGAGALLAALFAASVPAAAGAATADQRCVVTPAPAEEAAMTALIAAERRAVPARQLGGNATLVRAGRAKSAQMARGGRFTHSGSLPWAKGRAAGQNIAMAPAAGPAFEAMLGSPGHRANIVARTWRTLGVGASRSCSGQVFFTINFMGPPPRSA